MLAVLFDREQIVGSSGMMSVRDGGCRRRTDCRNLAARSFEPHGGVDVIVAVQDQLHTMPLQHRQQALRIRQALEAAVMVGAQRMMDQQHAKGMRFGKLWQQAIERVDLPCAEFSGGH